MIATATSSVSVNATKPLITVRGSTPNVTGSKRSLSVCFVYLWDIYSLLSTTSFKAACFLLTGSLQACA